MIMNLCDYEHTWTMCAVVWVKVSSPLQVAVISKGFLTLTDFRVEWTDTNALPFSSYMHVSMVDPTTRQNSTQGIRTRSLDSLTSIPVAFQMWPLTWNGPDQKYFHPILKLLSFCSSNHLPASFSTHIQCSCQACWSCKCGPHRLLHDTFIIFVYGPLLSTMNYIHKQIYLTDQKFVLNNLWLCSWTFLSTNEFLH